MAEDPQQSERLERLRARDPEALVALYREYGQRMFSLAFRLLNDRGAAEEVVQDVFWKLWQQPEMYRPEAGRLIAWLCTVTRNLALDRKRKENRRAAAGVSIDVSLIEDPAGDPQLLSLADPFLSRTMHSALENLPGDQRQVIELAYFEGMTHAEMAESLGEALGTVKTRLRLGLDKLRAAMRARRQVNQ